MLLYQNPNHQKAAHFQAKCFRSNQAHFTLKRERTPRANSYFLRIHIILGTCALNSIRYSYWYHHSDFGLSVWDYCLAIFILFSIKTISLLWFDFQSLAIHILFAVRFCLCFQWFNGNVWGCSMSHVRYMKRLILCLFHGTYICLPNA